MRAWGALRSVWGTVDELLERSRLHAVRHTPVGSLAYGVQKRTCHITIQLSEAGEE